jgi:hypothetical protein
MSRYGLGDPTKEPPFVAFGSNPLYRKARTSGVV